MGIELSDFSAANGKFVLKHLNLAVRAGEILCLLGPSGSGKSTLLQAVAGILPPLHGTVKIGEKDVTKTPLHKRGTPLVFQNPILFDRSVRENIEFGIDDPAVPLPRRRYLTDLALSGLRITDLAQRNANTLSGGQKQRVALARALVSNPQALLLDEPLAHLEQNVRTQIHIDLVTQIRRFKIPTVYVTHDIDDALSVSDRVAVLGNRTILQEGAPESVYYRPNCKEVARLLGISNILSCTVTDVRRTEDAGHAADFLPAPDFLGVAHIGERRFTFPCAQEFRGPGLACIAPARVLLGRTAEKQVVGQTGNVISSVFHRWGRIYHIETVFGTLVSCSKRSFHVGQYVDFSFSDGWIIPQ